MIEAIEAVSTAPPSPPWWQAWAIPIGTIVGAFISVFVVPWLNRRNAKVTATAQAKKDEATAAQVIEQSAISLIEKWQEIADDTQKKIDDSSVAAHNAERRAAAAELHASAAEQRALGAERRADEAEGQVELLRRRIAVLEEALRAAGLTPPN